MSDLIVIGYPAERAASRVWDELARLQRNYLADLEGAAIIWRDCTFRLADARLRAVASERRERAFAVSRLLI